MNIKALSIGEAINHMAWVLQQIQRRTIVEMVWYRGRILIPSLPSSYLKY